MPTNFFSGAYSPINRITQLLELTRNQHELVSSDYAVNEIRRNLARKTPASTLQRLDKLLRFVTVFPSVDIPMPSFDLAAKDVPILATAQVYRCDILLTGDKRDFGQWMNRPQDTGGVRVMMVAQLLAEWAGA